MTMRKLWLDYQRPMPGHQWPGWVLLASSLVAAGVVIAQYVTIGNAVDLHEQQVAKLKREVERQHLFASVADDKASAQKLTITPANNGTLARWEKLFSTLEKSSDETVTLLGISTATQEITLNGEAKNLPAVTAYIKRLQTTTTLSNVQLTEQGQVKDNPQHPIRFTALADWQLPSP